MTRILVVDDERSIRSTLKAFLREEGYEVHAAEEAEEAFALMKAHAFDVVVTDIVLPRMSGTRLLARVRESSPDIPVIMITGEPEVGSAAESVRAGAFDYLTKPITREAIGQAVMRAARAKVLNDERRKLKEENIRYQEHLEELVEERTEALRESENRLKTLFEYAPDAYYLNDMKGNFIDGNRAAEELTGYKREELVGKNFMKLKLLPAKQIPRAAARLAKNALGKPTGPDEFILNRKDGSKVPVEIRTFPVKIKGRRVVLGIARDITERKKTAEALRESEEKLRTIFDQANDVIVFANKYGTIIEVNARVRDILGYNQEEIRGRNFMKLGVLRLRDAPKIMKAFRESVKTGRVKDPEGLGRNLMELEFKSKSGALVPVEIITSTVVKGGKLEGFLSVIRDITERKKASEALRESEEKFRNVFENTLIGMYRATPEGEILMANPALVKMLGFYSFEELRLRNLEKGGYISDYPRVEFKKRIRTEGKITGLESMWKKRDGSMLFVRENVRAVYDEEGKIWYYEGTVEDITERKQAEEEATIRNASIEASLVPMLITDINGALIYVNGALLELHGYEAMDELIGKSAGILFAGQREYETSMESLKKTGSWSSEFTGQRKDGSQMEMYGSVNTVLDDTGKPVYIVASAIDVTEQKKARETLQKRTEFLDTIIESLPHPFYITDVNDYSILMANSAARRFQPSAGFCYALAHESQAPCDGHEHPCPLQIVKDTGRSVRVIHIHRDKKGDPRTVEVHGHPILDSEGNVVQMIEYCLDITDQKKAEESLRESEEKYRTLFEQASDAIVLENKDEEIVDFSERATELFGYSREELLTMRTSDLPSPGYQRLSIYSHPEQPLNQTIEREIIQKDGTKRNVEIAVVPFRSQKQLLFMSIVRDITNRTEMLRVLEESEEKYRTLVEEAEDGIYVLQDRRFVYVNPAFCSMFGYTRDECTEIRDFMELVAEDSVSFLEERTRKLEKGEELSPTYEFTARTRIGKKINVRVSVRSIIYQGRPARQGIARDISREKEHEEEFLNVIANTSHLINTPLTVALGQIEMVKLGFKEMSPELAEKVHEKLMMIRKLVIDELTKNVILLTKETSDGFTPMKREETGEEGNETDHDS